MSQSPTLSPAGFVAINTIECEPSYIARFEELFQSRARAIDRLPGFLRMQVLRPSTEGEPYLVVSEWADEASFLKWTASEEFRVGHRRAFEDIAEARGRGEVPPMRSEFRTYSVLTT